MDAYALHLAMAALVGASFVAVSAYYIHRKTLSELLEFARAVERERERDRPEDADRTKKTNRKALSRKRGTGSLPNVTAAAEVDGEVEAAERFLSNGHLVDLGIPPGLPRLHTGIEGSKESVCANSTERAGHLIRPISPKSPGASAFESVEGSDDDELPNDVNLDNSYLHANGNHDLPDDIRANGDNNPLPSTSMIRSHSASGDLHGVQPDPVTADILRREPEQETFVRMKISPRETPSSDEAEVYKVIQECIELRQSYVFKEEIAPWEKEVITDPGTPKPNPNPFAYTTQQKSDHFFQMVDGVVHVYTSQHSMERIFPVADATTFFTYFHHIL